MPLPSLFAILVLPLLSITASPGFASAPDIRDGLGKDLEPQDYGVEFHHHGAEMKSRSVAGEAVSVGAPRANLRVALVIGSPVSAGNQVLRHPEDASAPSRSRIMIRDRFELLDRFA